MLYKLYRNRFSAPPPKERRQLFKELYEKHGVELIGVFQNKENPLEYYMITVYRDNEHYQEFIATVKEIPEYIEMTKRVSEVRIDSSVVDLVKTDD